MLPQLVRRQPRASRVLPHLLVRLGLILRRIRLARHPWLRSLQHLHLRLQLQLQPHDPELCQRHRRRDPACHCGHLLLRAARLREHVLRRQGLGLRALLAHLRQCNAIHHVPAHLLRDKRVPVRRKACALLAPHRRIVRAARRRVVLVVRQGSVLVDRLRDSRSALAAAADQVVATIKGR